MANDRHTAVKHSIAEVLPQAEIIPTRETHAGPFRALEMRAHSLSSAENLRAGVLDYEVLTSKELATRLKVPESWIVEQSKRSRTSDPIPVFRLGKHRRYRWGSPEMNLWLERRAGETTRRAGSRKTRNGGNE